MKRKNLLIIVSLIAFIVGTAGTLTETGKSGKSGSPSEGTCVNCHADNPLNSQGGSVVITSTMSNWKYQPGQTYTMTVTISETGKVVFGLCFEALKSDNTNAGTLVITNSTQTQTMTASNGRTCVNHRMDGGFVTTPGSKAFSFNWTAPATNVGNITLYVASIAGDHDGTESGDNVYSTTQVITPVVTSVDELSANVYFSLSPNPVNDVLNLYIDNLNSHVIRGELYSITGSKVADLFSETVSGNTFEKHISVASFAKGIYFVKVNTAVSSATKRIIIE